MRRSPSLTDISAQAGDYERENEALEMVRQALRSELVYNTAVDSGWIEAVLQQARDVYKIESPLFRGLWTGISSGNGYDIERVIWNINKMLEGRGP